MILIDKPELSAVQLVPLFVERKVPPPYQSGEMPANRLVSLNAREVTWQFGGMPESASVQLQLLFGEFDSEPGQVQAECERLEGEIKQLERCRQKHLHSHKFYRKSNVRGSLQLK